MPIQCSTPEMGPPVEPEDDAGFWTVSGLFRKAVATLTFPPAPCTSPII